MIWLKKQNSDLKIKLSDRHRLTSEWRTHSSWYFPKSNEILQENFATDLQPNDSYNFLVKNHYRRYKKHNFSLKNKKEKENLHLTCRRGISIGSNISSEEDFYFKTTTFNGQVENKVSKLLPRSGSFKSNESMCSFSRRQPEHKDSSIVRFDKATDEDIDLFLEDERLAQQEFLEEPIKIEDIKGNNNLDKSNLTNVLNNQLINKKILSGKKNNSKFIFYFQFCFF